MFLWQCMFCHVPLPASWDEHTYYLTTNCGHLYTGIVLVLIGPSFCSLWMCILAVCSDHLIMAPNVSTSGPHDTAALPVPNVSAFDARGQHFRRLFVTKSLSKLVPNSIMASSQSTLLVDAYQFVIQSRSVYFAGVAPVCHIISILCPSFGRWCWALAARVCRPPRHHSTNHQPWFPLRLRARVINDGYRAGHVISAQANTNNNLQNPPQNHRTKQNTPSYNLPQLSPTIYTLIS